MERGEGVKPPEKWSAQRITQELCFLRNWQFMQKPKPDLENKLREQISLWGGAEAIDQWLQENDPGHGIPSGVEGLNWDWLNNSPED